jgi:hypothetical protein
MTWTGSGTACVTSTPTAAVSTGATLPAAGCAGVRIYGSLKRATVHALIRQSLTRRVREHNCACAQALDAPDGRA